MVMAAQTIRRWTVEEVYNLPADGNRYEVVHGELLVTPAPVPIHQVVISRLFFALGDYLRPLGLGDVLFSGPVDFFHGTDVYVMPDMVVATPGEVTTSWRQMKRLRLCIEVLSPSSARGDRFVKRLAYQAAGVETYWVVDPDNKVVEVWHPDDEVAELATRELRWQAGPGAPVLTIDLRDIFRPIGAGVQA